MEKRILVIDDDSDGSNLIKLHYTKKGCTVETAGTLKEGIEKINETVPDILFLDHNLPDGLGWAMAAKMQKTFPGLHIVLLTAYDAPPYPVTGSDMEFTRLEKPVTLDKLDAILLKE